jgi:hypothetical protein
VKYKVKLFMSQYVKVGDEYQVVDTSRTFKFKEWDDVQNFIGYMVEGADGAVKFEIEQIEEA